MDPVGENDPVPAGGGARAILAEPRGDLTATGDLPAGAILGRYRIVDVIGRGGMGTVYRAEHTDLGMTRALKTLSPEWRGHPLARARFLREAKAAAMISHPHVVTIFDCGSAGELPFFVMDLLRGEDLAATLRRTTLTVEQTAGIMLAVCAAISEMHEQGLIHRDLKPGNLFLARDKLGNIVPTVLDFGIAKPSAADGTASAAATDGGVIVGTARYVSPEQLREQPAGELTDQYALGVVLYQCVTGRVPFDDGSTVGVFRRIARFQFARPCELRGDIPADFERVILTAMNERPGDRFASVHEVGRALLPFASLKHRSQWADYYGRERESMDTLSEPIPVTASATWLPRPIHPATNDGAIEGGGTRRLPRATAASQPLARTLPMPGGDRTPLLPLLNQEAFPAVGQTQPLPVEENEDWSRTTSLVDMAEASGSTTPRPPSRFRPLLIGGVSAMGIAAIAAVWFLAVGSGRVGSHAQSESNPMVSPETPTRAMPIVNSDVSAPFPVPEQEAAARVQDPKSLVPPLVPRPATHSSRPRRRSPAASRSAGVRSEAGGGSAGAARSSYPAVGRSSDSQYPAMK